ncbi:hypothetical protein [Peredibacter starrii]|uniref:Alpha/beta hydrolase n=1 Tax=Peredibacter starrii TaxID=28202 RepID=A0AAX4HTE9_9BACT|nr:hypothetical protein [Peredibacter starrii]WPU66487.1 hypothetical protein SOO65_06980 [Peredibacter starrii]
MKFIYAAFFFILALPVRSETCKSESITLTELDFKVDLLVFGPKSSSKHILVIPPTGGTNVIDRNWAKKFCEAGFRTHILEHFTNDDEYALDLDIHQRFYSRTQRAIGMYLATIPPEHYVGLLGTSIGGIHAAMAMGLYDRPNSAFVIASGADMPSMIANSDQELMVTAWKKRQKLFNIPDKKTYIDLLSEKIPYDPLKLPRKFENKDLGMILATSDTTVPYENQKKLQEHWRPKTVINYSFNHFGAIVLSWVWDGNSVVKFFNDSSKAQGH